MINPKIIENTCVEIIRKAVIYLPDDVKNALKTAYENEVSDVAKAQLKAILDNVRLAESIGAPICQDTGTMIFFVKAGSSFPGIKYVEESIINATRIATSKVPLRPNAVHPFTNKNSGDNTGRFIPYIHWSIVDGDSLEITVMPKGGGSENVCKFRMLTPAEGIEGVKKFIISSVLEANGMPCPPTIVGVGIGGCADVSMVLAKKALLRPLNQRSSEPQIAEMEVELYNLLNETGIGPMGLGGKTTVLGVNIEYAHRHVASLPVAVAFNCWAARRASAVIYADGSYKILG
jgi:fumarate hydratase subunit alpha